MGAPQGKEEDVEVGLTYFGKRYLNPLLGRWVSPDPLAVHVPGEVDLNLYAYVKGQALRAIDPLGLQVDEGGTGQPNVGPNEPQVSGGPPPSATPQEAGPGTGSEGYHAGGAGKWKSSCEQSQKADTDSGARGTSAGGEGEYQSTPSTPCGPNMCGGGSEGTSGDHRYSDPVATAEAMDEAAVKITIAVGEAYVLGKALKAVSTLSRAGREARLARQLEAAEKEYVEALRGGAGQTAGKPLYRSMSRAEAEAVKETGRLRGGNPGETYWTDSRYRSAGRAQKRLGLPHRPEVQMEFVIKNKPRLERAGTRVEPAYGQEGRGREYMSLDPVEVEITNAQPYTH